MKNRQIMLITIKSMQIIAIIWLVGFVFIAGFRLLVPEKFDPVVNIFELTYGLVWGIVILIYMTFKSNRYIYLGTALAVFSWTLGQIFWFSYTSITGNFLPYPSVGDMGYTGTYLLLIGVISIIINAQPFTPKRWYRFTAFLVLLVPFVLFFAGKNKTEALLFNFILGLVVAYAIFKALALLRFPNYRWFAAGIFLLGITDILFMISVSLFPEDYTLISDAFYPISLSLIASGILKGDEALHD